MAADLLATVCAEIEARRDRLRPAAEEYEQLLSAAVALGTGAAQTPAEPKRTPPRRKQAPRARQAAPRKAPASPAARRRSSAPASAARNASQQAIVAALEHGSHTVAELAVVTAMPGPSIRESLRRLLKAGTVAKAKRDGKGAYALAS
jgi:Bacterial regulatory protein, arsR family